MNNAGTTSSTSAVSTTSIASVARRELRGVEDRVYLYTGAEAPSLYRHADSVGRYLANKSAGDEGRLAHERELATCRERLARLMSSSPDRVALVSNASEALNRLVASLGLPPGGNVVTTDLEFPSVVQSLLSIRSAGVEVRVARQSGWDLDVDDIARLVDDDTGLIMVSHVSYVNGLRLDLAALSALAARHGARLVVDATQSLGVVPVAAELADYVVASSYKWLLGPHGLGVLHVRDPLSARADRSGVGWRSVPDIFAADRLSEYELWGDARRFELGFPSFPSVYLLNDSLELLGRFSPVEIENHVCELTTELVEGLAGLGRTVMTPREPLRRAGNVSIEAADGAELARALLERGVMAWGGDGRVRFSVHLFNTPADIRTVLECLKELT